MGRLMGRLPATDSRGPGIRSRGQSDAAVRGGEVVWRGGRGGMRRGRGGVVTVTTAVAAWLYEVGVDEELDARAGGRERRGRRRWGGRSDAAVSMMGGLAGMSEIGQAS